MLQGAKTGFENKPELKAFAARGGRGLLPSRATVYISIKTTVSRGINMQKKSFDKHHRLKNYNDDNFNYSAMGSYLVTFNTKNRDPVLSEVICSSENPEDAETKLSEIGSLVKEYIDQIPAHYEGVTVDSYVIMPDHVHILLTFCVDGYSNKYENSKLSTIIRTLKTLVTKKIGYSIWQLDYYDTVAFADKSYDSFLNYIAYNPAVWFFKNKEEPKLK
ncbi:MAG: hypothetical protein IJS90_00240 [Clostridia bacterium]|nr:hypothetical protein [Clostridia bacterium]